MLTLVDYRAIVPSETINALLVALVEIGSPNMAHYFYGEVYASIFFKIITKLKLKNYVHRYSHNFEP